MGNFLGIATAYHRAHSLVIMLLVMHHINLRLSIETYTQGIVWHLGHTTRLRRDESGITPGYRDLVMAIHCLSVGVPMFDNMDIVM